MSVSGCRIYFIMFKGTLTAILGVLIPFTVATATPVPNKDIDVYGKYCASEYVQFHDAIVPLGDLISRGEGDWNAVNRGRAGDTPGGIQGLTGQTFENYTVGEVIDMQSRSLYAVGRYQFIPSTLRLAVNLSSVSHLDMFTPETQNRLFAALLEYKRPAVAAYIKGHHDLPGWALNELAKEWASIEYRNGRGFYDHIGGNRAHITREEVITVVNEIREEYNK